MIPDKNNISILVADDEEDIRDVFEIALMDAGYTVFLAENGQNALEIFRKNRPDIVITDIKMPVMDGIELLKRIKRENPETQVLMITGHGDMDLTIRSLKHDAFDFITKPVNVDILEIAIEKAVENAGCSTLICTCLLVMSGTASIGNCDNDHAPNNAATIVNATTQ
jgi:DNA-binding NtrC family response regulator